MPEAPDNKCPYCDGAGTPVAWQWRRTNDEWSLRQTSNFEMHASVHGTQVRALYAGPAIDGGNPLERWKEIEQRIAVLDAEREALVAEQVRLEAGAPVTSTPELHKLPGLLPEDRNALAAPK